MMNLQDFASIAEIVGGFAVLATLIYLVIELRNNTSILRAEASNSSYNRWAEFNTMLSQHPDKHVFARSLDPNESFENFDLIDQFTLSCLGRTMIQRFSASYFHYKAGILDVANWDQHAIFCHSVFALPVWGAWWREESKQAIYSQ